MRDIANREDVCEIVDAFYTLAMKDSTIGHFFNEVVKLELKHHLPVIVDFWTSVLWNEASYKGNPMLKHIELSKMAPLKELHFQQWLHLWRSVVNERFEGEMSVKAIQRAESIASLMLHKIRKLENNG